MTLKMKPSDEHRKPLFQPKAAASLLDRLIERHDRSANSARLKDYRAASLGLNNPTAAARKLNVAPGRVAQLIRTGQVKLYPLDNRFHYVKVKEVRRALAEERATTQ